jgi:hypothetical protein
MTFENNQLHIAALITKRLTEPLYYDLQAEA